MAAIRTSGHSPTSSTCAIPDPPLLMIGMATCHSLTIIDNVLSGDPLDLKVCYTLLRNS